MGSILVNSQVQEIGTFRSQWTDEEVKNEPMLFNCNGQFAHSKGGDITRNFLNNLWAKNDDWCNLSLDDIVVDSRVHMLMPGWYPCIPGFHHDDVPRNTTNGQPDYTSPEYRSQHVMGLVNAEICPTQFALGEIELELPSDDKIIYKEWHPVVQKAVDCSTLDHYSVKSGVITQFDDRSFHQGVKAVKGGWRWFIRVSRNTNRKPTNEVRKQVQVYLETPMEGW